MHTVVRHPVLLLLVLVTLGCGGQSAAPPQSAESVAATPGAAPSGPSSAPAIGTPAAADAPRSIPTISLSGSTSASTVPPDAEGRTARAGASPSVSAPDRRREQVIAALKPLQIMLGDWRGTTQKEFGDFKALDEPHWVWDFLSEPSQPALVMTSQQSPYFREARLTYLPEDELYTMQTRDREGIARSFSGQFSQAVEEFQGDDRRIHRRYKLELTQTDAAVAREAWQLVLNQLDNNRYLVELARRRGTGFLRFDTVATQRSGTSFAKSDDSYGERECIISGGLGTISVSYQGKTYWVCCTGCQAAFNEDPAKWLAARNVDAAP